MIPRRSPAAAWQRIDGELVLLSPDQGEMVGVNAVGARAWDLFDGRRSLDEVSRQIAAEFSAPVDHVASDLEAFVKDLGAAGLLELP